MVLKMLNKPLRRDLVHSTRRRATEVDADAGADVEAGAGADAEADVEAGVGAEAEAGVEAGVEAGAGGNARADARDDADGDIRVDVDVVVVGTGLVGAAVLERLSRRRLFTLAIDRAARLGGEVSVRNSGVVHAGLHYPPQSLKTRLSVRGNQLVAAWCAAHGVPFQRPGKVIVAQRHDEDLQALERLRDHGREVGVEGLTMLNERALVARVARVVGSVALWVPNTGIVDPVALGRSLLAGAQARGAEVLTNAELVSVERCGDVYQLHTSRGAVRARVVINAAGLHADSVARLVGATVPDIFPCRGDYYRIQRPLATPHLVYPVPGHQAPGLGVHLTFDVHGAMRFGPDAYYVDSKTDYGDPPESKRSQFGVAVRSLFPEIQDEHLAYDSCGLRPKLRPPWGTTEEDFVIREEPAGFIHLVGIDSPGLTSALALAEEIEHGLLGSVSSREFSSRELSSRELSSRELSSRELSSREFNWWAAPSRP